MSIQNLTPTASKSDSLSDSDLIEYEADCERIPKGINVSEIKTEVERLIIQGNESAKKQINPFPIEVFPLPIQEIIKTTNKSLGFPVDFIGVSMLYTASVAIGNVFRVQMKHTYEESCVLYLAIVARPGTNKSHPVRWACKR